MKSTFLFFLTNLAWIDHHPIKSTYYFEGNRILKYETAPVLMTQQI